MANLYDISALSYQPSSNMDWFTKAVFGGKLIEKGKITPIIGVKESTLLNLVDLSGNILQADGRDCAWTPQQIAKLSDKELKVKTYKINLEQCLDDLERKRTIWMMGPGAKNTELPDTLEEATMALLASELSSEIEKAFASLPEDVAAAGLEKESLNIYVSYATLMKVKIALAGVFGNNVVVNPNFIVENDAVKYLGAEIVPVKGIGEDDMVVAEASNFLLGTDLMSDLEEMRLGQFPAPNDSKIFIDGRLRLGFAIPFEDEVVFYSKNN